MTASAIAAFPGARRAGSAWTVAFSALLAIAFAGFVALGVWQLQRMAWKDALIARVEARLRAAPVAPPARSRWSTVDEVRDGYRRVRLVGTFLPVPETRTQAVTELGAGHWALAPLRTANGDILFVNRGFVPGGAAGVPPPAGRVEIVGLLRMNEPGGGFLRRNRPDEERWYSRDTAAIARRRGLPAEAVAPFFVDAAADADAVDNWPQGGLTVVRFRDSHLSYALTWFGLAALAAIGGGCLLVSGRRLRQDRRDTFVR